MEGRGYFRLSFEFMWGRTADTRDRFEGGAVFIPMGVLVTRRMMGSVVSLFRIPHWLFGAEMGSGARRDMHRWFCARESRLSESLAIGFGLTEVCE